MSNSNILPAMKTIKIIILVLLSTTYGFSQGEEKKEKFFEKHPFVSMTEFGLLLGRVQSPNNYYYPMYKSIVPPNYEPTYGVETVASLSFQSFNGIYLTPKTAVGVTAGVDWYSSVLLLPVAAGVRQTLIQKKNGGSSIYAGLDAGYGTTWLQVDDSNHKTTGGVMLNPTIGFRLPMKNQSAWLINFGYKFQELSIEQTNVYDAYYSSIENRKHQRMSFRLGFEF